MGNNQPTIYGILFNYFSRGKAIRLYKRGETQPLFVINVELKSLQIPC